MLHLVSRPCRPGLRLHSELRKIHAPLQHRAHDRPLPRSPSAPQLPVRPQITFTLVPNLLHRHSRRRPRPPHRSRNPRRLRSRSLVAFLISFSNPFQFTNRVQINSLAHAYVLQKMLPKISPLLFSRLPLTINCDPLIIPRALARARQSSMNPKQRVR